MIKIANNIARMLEKRSAATPTDYLTYTGNLGGFHTGRSLPQSMIPEEYQARQARLLLNPTLDLAELSSSPEEMAMLANTNFVPGMMQAVNTRFPREQLGEGMKEDTGKMFFRPEEQIFDNSNSRNFSDQANFMAQRGMIFDPTALNTPRRYVPGGPGYGSFFGHVDTDRNQDGFQLGPSMQHARYDITPDNPTGLTANNAASAQTVSGLANKALADRANIRNARR